MNGQMQSDLLDASLAELLGPVESTVQSTSFDSCRFKVNGEASLEVTARREDGWLLLHAAVGRTRGAKQPTARRLLWLLEHNARLCGGVKFALYDVAPPLGIAAEIPLDDESGLAIQFEQACSGFRQGALLLAHKKSTETTTGQNDDQSGGRDTEIDDLAGLCQQAGWPASRRDDGSVVVPLDVPDAFCQAFSDSSEDGRIRWRVELGGDRSISAASRLAAGVLLLGASGLIRMARAASARLDDREAYCWETTISDATTGRQLQCALASLSVACRLSAREIEVLGDESIARKYLTARGWSSLLPDHCPS